ncbi:unnamed protein product [Angiostrongylus costaricensis]|uniref:Tudor domain-containing protein n=1 Tax=Angiostrongylus costaricensis TaxID=334426 RepID=A0A158PI62_ANGCS|nr:unnamed protein product [Angiostrongylus costaricensis]
MLVKVCKRYVMKKLILSEIETKTTVAKNEGGLARRVTVDGDEIVNEYREDSGLIQLYCIYAPLFEDVLLAKKFRLPVSHITTHKSTELAAPIVLDNDEEVARRLALIANDALTAANALHLRQKANFTNAFSDRDITDGIRVEIVRRLPLKNQTVIYFIVYYRDEPIRGDIMANDMSLLSMQHISAILQYPLNRVIAQKDLNHVQSSSWWIIGDYVIHHKTGTTLTIQKHMGMVKEAKDTQLHAQLFDSAILHASTLGDSRAKAFSRGLERNAGLWVEAALAFQVDCITRLPLFFPFPMLDAHENPVLDYFDKLELFCCTNNCINSHLAVEFLESRVHNRDSSSFMSFLKNSDYVVAGLPALLLASRRIQSLTAPACSRDSSSFMSFLKNSDYVVAGLPALLLASRRIQSLTARVNPLSLRCFTSPAHFIFDSMGMDRQVKYAAFGRCSTEEDPAQYEEEDATSRSRSIVDTIDSD